MLVKKKKNDYELISAKYLFSKKINKIKFYNTDCQTPSWLKSSVDFHTT